MIASLASRVVRRSGFLLGLLLFLFLPFATASCDVPAGVSVGRGGTFEESVAGLDLVRDSYNIRATDDMASRPAVHSRLDRTYAIDSPVQWLAIAVVVVLVLGLATAQLRTQRVRDWLATAAAVVGIGLLVVTEVLTLRSLHDTASFFAVLSSDMPQFKHINLADRVGEVVHIEVGFWLALAALVPTLVANAAPLLRRGNARPG
nr:hypothetical protein [Kibdelosporangium sp. MJ126-NF4]